MDPDEIFKRFFGVSFPEIGNRPFSPVNDKEGDNRPEEFHPRTDGTDLFGDMHVRIHQQMEEMDKQMQDMFRLFSFHNQMPSAGPALPGGSEEDNPSSGSSARDHMLKEEGGATPTPRSRQPPSSQPFSGGVFFSPSWFEQFTGTPGLNSIPPKEIKDNDIDGESPSKDDVVDLYKQTRDPFGYFFGGGQSVNIQTVVGGDGVMEERRTVRDASGHEETTVTRRMGDKSHTVTTVKDDKGLQEKRETFQNIDKDKMSEFDKQWQGKGHYPAPVTDSGITISQPGGALSDNRGFFRKFFGF